MDKMDSIPLVDLNVQYKTIKGEIDDAIQRVIDSSAFIMGPEIEAFEIEFAAYCGAQYCVGLNSGTDALHLALIACGVSPGDEVITTPHTFIATAEAITMCEATPVFVDIDPETYNIDPGLIEGAITSRTKAIIPVHLYGQPADMDPINELAKKYKLHVIEDAAQAHGAMYKGRRVGGLSEAAAAFSFYPGKNLGAYGDAGALVTSDSETAEKARLLRNHGREEKYTHRVIGYNKRMDTLQAAILRVKLQHLDEWNEAKREIAAYYTDRLSSTALITPSVLPDTSPVWHLYVVRCNDRDTLRKQLQEAGISSGIHYPIPLHLQPAYAHLELEPGSFPQSESAAQSILSLPMYPELKKVQMDRVIGTITT